MCCPRGATKEELIFKTDGAVAITDMEFENWNSSRSSFSLSPTLQYSKMGIKRVSGIKNLVIRQEVVINNNQYFISR
jgi:hypothetical protein